MNSFAFWYQKDQEGTPLQATVHFNLFYGCGWVDEPFLDIGFLIKGISHAKKLCFFMPFEIKDSEKTKHIYDLGKKLKDKEVLEALFNNSYRIENESEPKSFYAFDCYDSDESFVVYELDVSNDFHLEAFNSDHDGSTGTILSINTDNLKNVTNNGKEKCYLRFRVKGHSLDFLIHEYTTPYKALQNVFHTTYMVDFRYNNTRSLPNTIVEKMRGQGNNIVNVNALHFLLITKAYVAVAENSFSRVRIIEHGVWQNYVSDNGDNRDTKDLVAYHYVDKNEEGQNKKSGMFPSDLFVKFQVEKTIVLRYLLLTVALGAAGSGIIELIKMLIALMESLFPK